MQRPNLGLLSLNRFYSRFIANIQMSVTLSLVDVWTIQCLSSHNVSLSPGFQFFSMMRFFVDVSLSSSLVFASSVVTAQLTHLVTYFFKLCETVIGIFNHCTFIKIFISDKVMFLIPLLFCVEKKFNFINLFPSGYECD